MPEYEGGIGCIYIDPPYNMGNEGWVYNDNVNDPHIRRWLGELVVQEGEDLTRHDKWACIICINGFINHYPDFIARMKSGNTVLVETKGDHLNNDDSRRKIYVGRKWVDLAGMSYHYFMVFENIDVEGAINVKTLMIYLKDL